MKRFKCLFFIILMLSAPVFADVYDYPAGLESIAKQIPQIKNTQCKFRQEKYLKNIKKPLYSGGTFEFIENKGVYFNTTYPIQSSVDYTNKNYKQINDIIKAISSKRYAPLEKEFSFFYSGNIDNWELGMKPKKVSNAYNYISHITINGTNYIKRIEISQTNGNKTIIWFEK